ncbi:hypothetical protein [Vineibacter terrae]|uniref:hypothetical protein n=1 Tax=Vineibacter terrae TaxID=2586908 RepID=UPI002E377CF2|nr:hypothetical protein [Vineibacter terrae]HEX2892268.1 hypothetical protein [Vineibacter terrae]
MRIVVSSDVDRIIRDYADLEERQFPFAKAKALTKTAQDAQGDVRADLPNRFTLRNTWVSKGIRITPAKKTALTAEVGSLEPFMARQETGGTKKARDHSRVAVPSQARRNKRGMIPRGERPAGLRGKPRVFLMKTAGGVGIVRRATKARTPIQFLYWLKADVQVRPAFGFKKAVGTTVARAFGPNFVAALDQARATAR